MAFVLFTDFGSADLYVGQVEAVLERDAPGARVIHLLHEAPMFDPRASAHLLAALASRLPPGHVHVCVVDPGVGSARGTVVLNAGGNWFVGPDNGLLSVIAGRAATRRLWRVTRDVPGPSVSFHGRDLFAPLAAAVATGRFPSEQVAAAASLEVDFGADDLPEIVYVDHYGNAFTGLRAAGLPTDRRLVAHDREIAHARVFAEAPSGKPFWYENSAGLVEIAMRGASAARALGLAIGDPVQWR
ncbi:MAG: SAM-dependent chlorinase/fluorinase [Burkholderiales bacterium]|nr:SAM-dependent chlorinase/fluorinase [Burkholderiales bacterium]